MHRGGQLRARRLPVLAVALVPFPEIPPPDIDSELDGLRPAGDEQQEQQSWANEGLGNAQTSPESLVGNSSPVDNETVQQESVAVAEREEVTLWTDDLTAEDDFGDDVCSDLDGLSNNLDALDSLNGYLTNFSQVCNRYIQQQQSNNDVQASNDVCNVIQDAKNQFGGAFPCNDLQVTEWLVDWLESVFCDTGVPSG
jgi:hypothetical protein